jgi:hypothetical protein
MSPSAEAAANQLQNVPGAFAVATHECKAPQSLPTNPTRVSPIVNSIQLQLYDNRTSDPADWIECQKWLADHTRDQQTTSSTASIQAFPKFNTSIANNSQIATTHLVKAFMPVWLLSSTDMQRRLEKKQRGSALDPYVNSHAWNDIGFDLSTSLPVNNATLEDYGRQELLGRYGGLANLYLSFSGRSYTNDAYLWGNRAANLDRLYLVDLLSERQPASPREALGFLSQGFGLKALKTSLTGTDSLGAEATAYVGWGFDGPLFLISSSDTTDPSSADDPDPAGMASFEVYASGNWVNGAAAKALAQGTGGNQAFAAIGASLSMSITSSVAIEVQYVQGIGGGAGKALGHMATLTIGYNRKPDKPAK